MRNVSRIALAVVTGLILPAVAALAADTAPVALTPADMKWVPNPNVTGVMTATVWGDPAAGPHGALHKFVAGFITPLHTHSANLKIVVVSGTMSLTDKDGMETKLPAGSFATQPNTYQHVTKCLAGSECVAYVEADGKFDLKPVEPAAKK